MKESGNESRKSKEPAMYVQERKEYFMHDFPIVELLIHLDLIIGAVLRQSDSADDYLGGKG